MTEPPPVNAPNRGNPGLCAAALLIALAACGDSATNPSRPEFQVTLTGSADSVLYGRTMQAWVHTFADAQAVAPDNVDWSSSDTLVAVVDRLGMVLGVGIGNVSIAVTRNGERGEIRLRVVAQEPMPGHRFETLSLGMDRVCAVSDGGTVYCGPISVAGGSLPEFTELPNSASFRLKSLHVSLHSQCGLTNSGLMYCWGLNGHGHFGSGTSFGFRATDWPALGAGGRTFAALSVGGHAQTCGINKADSVVYCFGHSDLGQVGRGTTNFNDTAVAPVTGNLRARVVSTGHAYSCAVDLGGALNCWGSAYRADPAPGQLSATTPNPPERLESAPPLTSLTVGASHICGLDATGVAWCWGNSRGIGQPIREPDPFRRPGPVETQLRFTSLSAAWRTTCGTTKADEVHCWGEFLPKSVSERMRPEIYTPQHVARGQKFRAVTTSSDYACGLTPDGRLLCW